MQTNVTLIFGCPNPLEKSTNLNIKMMGEGSKKLPLKRGGQIKPKLFGGIKFVLMSRLKLFQPPPPPKYL